MPAPDFHPAGMSGVKELGQLPALTLFHEPGLVSEYRDLLRRIYRQTATTSDYHGDSLTVIVIEDDKIASYVPPGFLRAADAYMFDDPE